MSNKGKAGIRDLDQEPDTIALVPEDPEFVVIGTYSLTNGNPDSGSSSRKGSLQVVPFSEPVRSQPDVHFSLERLDFPFGIYDVHFHPQYRDLLGAATSAGHVQFYFLSRCYNAVKASMEFTFISLGEALVEEPDEDDGPLPIVTQFQFIHPEQQVQSLGDQHQRSVILAATTQFGSTKLLKTTLPYPVRTIPDDLSSKHDFSQDAPKSVRTQLLQIHQQSFDLEAWTTLPIIYWKSSKQVEPDVLVLSGGDDSQLLMSHLHLPSSVLEDTDIDTIDVNFLLTLKRTHQAGAVSICGLGPVQPSSRYQAEVESGSYACQWFILTGSYDETLRLFILNVNHSDQDLAEPGPPTLSFVLQAELALGGGVWRIKLLDSYENPAPLQPDAAISTDYILLIAGHTSGAHIVRLTITESVSAHDERKCEFKIEKSFTEGHDSLVYAVEARSGAPVRGSVSNQFSHEVKWEIMSTSFYDKRVCNWKWTDPRPHESGKVQAK